MFVGGVVQYNGFKSLGGDSLVLRMVLTGIGSVLDPLVGIWPCMQLWCKHKVETYFGGSGVGGGDCLHKCANESDVYAARVSGLAMISSSTFGGRGSYQRNPGIISEVGKSWCCALLFPWCGHAVKIMSRKSGEYFKEKFTGQWGNGTLGLFQVRLAEWAE